MQAGLDFPTSWVVQLNTPTNSYVIVVCGIENIQGINMMVAHMTAQYRLFAMLGLDSKHASTKPSSSTR